MELTVGKGNLKLGMLNFKLATRKLVFAAPHLYKELSDRAKQRQAAHSFILSSFRCLRA